MDQERRRQIEEEERYRLEMRKRLAAEGESSPTASLEQAPCRDVSGGDGGTSDETTPPPTPEVPSPKRAILTGLAVTALIAVVVGGIVAYENGQPASVTTLVSKRWGDDRTFLKTHCARKGLVNVAGTTTRWYHCSDITNDGDFARIDGDLYNVTREVEAAQALGGTP